MTKFDRQKLAGIVLYILNKTKGLDCYHVSKVICLANIPYPAKYGFRMTAGEFRALPDGPVPSVLYNRIRNGRHCGKGLKAMTDGSVSKGDCDAYYMPAAEREADSDCLSKADIEETGRPMGKNACLPYGELREKSHGEERNRAYGNPGEKVTDVLGMAKDGMAASDMPDYIKGNLSMESALL